MSQQHQACFNLLSSSIRSYQRPDGVMSLYISTPPSVIAAIGARVGVQNMDQLMDELGFTLSAGRRILLPHPFDIYAINLKMQELKSGNYLSAG